MNTKSCLGRNSSRRDLFGNYVDNDPNERYFPRGTSPVPILSYNQRGCVPWGYQQLPALKRGVASPYGVGLVCILVLKQNFK